MPLLFLPDALNARIMPTAPNIPVLCLYDAQYVCTVPFCACTTPLCLAILNKHRTYNTCIGGRVQA